MNGVDDTRRIPIWRESCFTNQLECISYCTENSLRLSDFSDVALRLRVEAFKAIREPQSPFN